MILPSAWKLWLTTS